MSYDVFISEIAQRDLGQFASRITKQIFLTAPVLLKIQFPMARESKKLQGYKENLYRLRAGDYRIVFTRSGTRIHIVRILSKPDFQRAF